MFLFDRNKKPKARKFSEKSGNDSQNGNAIVDTLYDVISYDMS
jgi:hypothetical protein